MMMIMMIPLITIMIMTTLITIMIMTTLITMMMTITMMREVPTDQSGAEPRAIRQPAGSCHCATVPMHCNAL